MKAILRSPWPLFGIGLAFSVLGTAVALSQPQAGRTWLGYVLCVPIFGGLLLVALSPALQDAVSDVEARRRLKGGLRWIGSWIFLLWAGSVLNDLLRPLLDSLGGPVGSPSRLLVAFGVFAAHLMLPFLLAAPLAEAVRRVAAWLGEA